MKHEFYADDSLCKLNPTSETDDTLFFGGIFLSEDEVPKIEKILSYVKRQYGVSGLPIKWNFKDLVSVYNQVGKAEAFGWMNRESADWRKRVLEESLRVNYKIIIGGIVSYTDDKTKTLRLRPQITRYVFTNVLQRVGFAAKEANSQRTTVMLDWPSGNNRKEFTEEYQAAFLSGKSISGHPYKCSRLQSLGFRDSPVFGCSHHSAMLQFTDLVVGATKDYVGTCLKSRPYSLGYNCTRMIRTKFRGYPNKISTHGLKLDLNGYIGTKGLLSILSRLSDGASGCDTYPCTQIPTFIGRRTA